jgi:hypothetical protein
VDIDEALRDQGAVRLQVGYDKGADEEVKTTVKKEEDNEMVTNDGQLTTNPWASTRALVKFRESAQKVAEEYLKANVGKLRRARKSKRSIGDKAAYRDGKEDSKKVDLSVDASQRRILTI